MTDARVSCRLGSMRIHLQVVDPADGAVLAEDTFESRAYVVSSNPTTADLTHPRLRATYQIESDGYHAILRHGASTMRLRQKNRVAVANGLELRIDLYPRPDAVPAVRGACPSCGGTLRSSQVGGAYRSIAREERRCHDCQTAVLSIDDAPSALGAFTDLSAGDWVMVTVARRCPTCTQSMLRSVLRTAKGSAEVERCPACRLVVVEPEDEAQLTGR